MCFNPLEVRRVRCLQPQPSTPPSLSSPVLPPLPREASCLASGRAGTPPPPSGACCPFPAIRTPCVTVGSSGVSCLLLMIQDYCWPAAAGSSGGRRIVCSSSRKLPSACYVWEVHFEELINHPSNHILPSDHSIPPRILNLRSLM